MANVALNVGFYNYVLSDKIVALVNSESAPMRRVIQEYRKSGRLIDATQGRKTKSVIFLEGGQVATSALPQDVLVKRMLSDNVGTSEAPTAEEVHLLSTQASPNSTDGGSGLLFVVSGPSAVGKDTILSELLTEQSGLSFPVREVCHCHHSPPRADEEAGRDYHFLTVPQFHHMAEEDGFLEYANVFGNWYGTPSTWVAEQRESGVDVILKIDVRALHCPAKSARRDPRVFCAPHPCRARAPAPRPANRDRGSNRPPPPRRAQRDGAASPLPLQDC